jgi:hypothetical protein
MNEHERLKEVAIRGETDFQRWADIANFQPGWDQRAELASRWIPPGASVLDLGCGKMALERYLPPDCLYIPSDLFTRDNRTIICNVATDPLPNFPHGEGGAIVTALGVTEYLSDVLAFYKKVRAFGVRFINSYHPVLPKFAIDRAAQGWINNLSFCEWMAIAEEARFRPQEMTVLQASQYLIAFEPQ